MDDGSCTGEQNVVLALVTSEYRFLRLVYDVGIPGNDNEINKLLETKVKMFSRLKTLF